jgi:hypothetical protein
LTRWALTIDDCSVGLHAFRFTATAQGRRARSAACAFAVVAFGALSARAEEGEPALGVDIHGFVSQGYLKTTANNYLAESKRGSPEFSEVGLNFTKSITEQLRVGAQLFARDLGPVGNYRPQFDWYYLDYRFADWFGLRAGRTKLPFGLYNEVQDVDAARVPALLPQSMYPLDQRDYLLAQTGGEAYGRVKLGAAGALEYRAYAGTIFIPIPSSSTPGISVDSIDVPYMYGGRLMWAPPLDGLQLGGSFQSVRLDAVYSFNQQATEKYAAVLPADFAGKVELRLPVKLWVASVEYSAHDFLFAAEYGRWVADIKTNAPALFPANRTISERMYAMASYHVTPWFSPGAYYSILYPQTRQREGRAHFQHDFAITFRYDLTENWLVKLEGHLMRGTAALKSDLNDGVQPDKLNKNWGLLVLKTTAYF